MPKYVLCVPTELERKLIARRIGRRTELPVEITGFGMVSAAARTSYLIQKHRPERMFLLGIAGAYGSDLAVGSATQFQKVACYGIGVGTGAQHRSAFDVGFPQTLPLAPRGKQPRTDILPIEFSAVQSNAELLLSVCSAAADPVEVDHRLEQFPSAAAEDMEGFGFAFSCQQANISAQIIRGISNVAGQRDRAEWRVEEAADAAAQLFQDVFDAILC